MNVLTPRSKMPSAHLTLKEEDVVKLVLEFLHSRDLHITQLSLERETGVINGTFSDDVLFLRQLILDGQWDDALEFVQPLESIEAFDMKQFTYIILKHKYVELLCIKSEVSLVQNIDLAVEEVVKCLNELEKYCTSKDEYSNLCLLLTLPRLSDHLEYKNWNPSNARVECFKAVYPLVEKFLPIDKKCLESHSVAKNDRMIQLVIKGILYESCVEYCQHKATASATDGQEMQFSKMLNGTGFSDSDLSLLSWLQSIPPETFACPFEQRTLSVDVERLEKPSLEASWTEHMLVTPIKPKTFPHSAVPFSRPRSADIMSRSLTPHLDGLPFGLGHQRHLMAMSLGDITTMSKSFAGFHLTGKKSMNTSVDRLFEEADVFTSSSCGDLPSLLTGAPKPPPRRPRSRSPEKKVKQELSKTRDGEKTRPSDPGGQGDSPSTPKKDSELKKENGVKTVLSSSPSELYKEYQKQKQKLQDQLEAQERQRDECLKQLREIENQHQTPDNKFQEETMGKQNAVADQTPLNAKSQQRCAGGDQQLNISTPKVSLGSRNVVSMQSTVNSSPGLPGNANNNMTDTPVRNNPVRNLGPILEGAGNLKSPFRQTYLPNATIPASDVVRDSSVAGPPSSVPYLNQTPQDRGSITSALTDSPNVQKFPPPVSNPYDASGMRHQNANSHSVDKVNGDNQGKKPRFIPVTSLEDVQAIRAAEFHPYGKLYAIGSNSKTLRVCAYPKLTDVKEDHVTYQPTVLFKRTKHHKGSIYCLAWNATGDLIATGSNDKTIKLMRFNAETCNMEGEEIELTMHDGTVRDVAFIEDMSNKSSLLISGGAGDCKIYVTDCVTGTPFQALSGHSGHILSLYTWGGAMFVSGSQDKTIRFWDLRTRGCVNIVTAPPPAGVGTGKGGPVAAVSVDPSGRLLVSGHEDANCMLYDIRGNRVIQCFKPHTSDIRNVRFSPSACYLLTGSYDHKIVLTDLQGDLTQPLPSVVVAEHQDKVIQGRWHPSEFSFLTTSADKTATLWALPPV